MPPHARRMVPPAPWQSDGDAARHHPCRSMFRAPKPGDASKPTAPGSRPSTGTRPPSATASAAPPPSAALLSAPARPAGLRVRRAAITLSPRASAPPPSALPPPSREVRPARARAPRTSASAPVPPRRTIPSAAPLFIAPLPPALVKGPAIRRAPNADGPGTTGSPPCSPARRRIEFGGAAQPRLHFLDVPVLYTNSVALSSAFRLPWRVHPRRNARKPLPGEDR
ncbi:hypothetical protein SPMU_24480 [Sphingomonas mucosissima]|uniref:Uncharacterized protein n=1 Tax=Sphingomonas mucosissima TaxID=370959 RepID=A0A245ZGR5_9SPHN|nr:hypothetical protein SPMU_24480 [Sphingomonas mucosissima]